MSHSPELHHADHERLFFSEKVFHVFLLLTSDADRTNRSDKTMHALLTDLERYYSKQYLIQTK